MARLFTASVEKPRVSVQVKKMSLRELLRGTRELFSPGGYKRRSSGLLAPAPDPLDPLRQGYDRNWYNGKGELIQETDVLDYTASTTDAANLSKKGLITGVLLVADPYQHDVATAAITVVEDAVDRLMSALSIVGGPTYFSLNQTPCYLKALGNQNKAVHGGRIAKEDLATPVAVDNLSRQSWYIHFGFLNDDDLYDISSGIPAEMLTSLVLSAGFAANNLIAVTAANGTVDPATDVYVITISVSGLPKDYYARMPTPQFEHDHDNTIETTQRFQLKTGLMLKRTTLVNLAVAASNNEPRNDGNITDVSVIFDHPVKQPMVDRMRWQLFKQLFSTFHSPEVDRDGAAAIASAGLPGVAVIDWRKLTGNAMGLDLRGMPKDSVRIEFTMGTTTGSMHLYHEYYSLPDPTVPDIWAAPPGWSPS